LRGTSFYFHPPIERSWPDVGVSCTHLPRPLSLFKLFHNRSVASSSDAQLGYVFQQQLSLSQHNAVINSSTLTYSTIGNSGLCTRKQLTDTADAGLGRPCCYRRVCRHFTGRRVKLTRLQYCLSSGSILSFTHLDCHIRGNRYPPDSHGCHPTRCSIPSSWLPWRP